MHRAIFAVLLLAVTLNAAEYSGSVRAADQFVPAHGYRDEGHG